jgi:AcrR family transcriptional regulator
MRIHRDDRWRESLTTNATAKRAAPLPANSAMVKRPARKTLPKAKLRLILCAEQLFADRGIDAVSQREIAIAAGNGNNNAVAYHFGSKDRLMDALFEHRIAEMSAKRQNLFERAQKQASLTDARTLLEIVLLPVLDQVDQAGRHSHAGFLQRYFTQRRTPGIPDMISSMSHICPALTKVLPLMRKQIKHVPKNLRESRIRRSELLFLTMVVSFDNAAPQNRRVRFSMLVDDTLQSAAACLCAPHRSKIK